ncbi:MAG TPA: DNA replication and repair protein RecF [Thermoleophilaceae bacterium]
MAAAAQPSERPVATLVVCAVELRDFRNYEHAAVELAPGLTVIAGSNGAGKTNLLEALYFGCTARSPRTSNERELVRRGATVTRVVTDTRDAEASHRIEVGFDPGGPKRLSVDGAAVDSLAATTARPLLSVFLPERLELVKGAPAARRAHLDQLVAALWPARAETRSAYSRALAQRNALLLRIRSGAAGPAALDAWDAELAGRGAALMDDRREAVDGLAGPFAVLAARLGLPGRADVRYRPRSPATDAAGLVTELGERRAADLERGFTAHGPHRDELQLLLDGVALRAYGSQGQQRAALLALLFAERELLEQRRARLPLMLLDDVMSELDAERRALLAELLRSGGQAVVTATDTDHVPGDPDALISVSGGRATTATEVPT